MSVILSKKKGWTCAFYMLSSSLVVGLSLEEQVQKWILVIPSALSRRCRKTPNAATQILKIPGC